MRRKSQKKYLNKAYWLPITYNGASVSYKDVGVMFRFGNYNGTKDIKETEIRVNESTNVTRIIETNSTIKFKRNDRIMIDGAISLVSKIEIKSDLGYGAIRKRPNRNIYILTLS